VTTITAPAAARTRTVRPGKKCVRRSDGRPTVTVAAGGPGLPVTRLGPRDFDRDLHGRASDSDVSLSLSVAAVGQHGPGRARVTQADRDAASGESGPSLSLRLAAGESSLSQAPTAAAHWHRVRPGPAQAPPESAPRRRPTRWHWQPVAVNLKKVTESRGDSGPAASHAARAPSQAQAPSQRRGLAVNLKAVRVTVSRARPADDRTVTRTASERPADRDGGPRHWLAHPAGRRGAAATVRVSLRSQPEPGGLRLQAEPESVTQSQGPRR
jgi:hypothetical protein